MVGFDRINFMPVNVLFKGLWLPLAACALGVVAQMSGQTLTINTGGPKPVVLTQQDLTKMPRLSVAITEHGGAKVIYEGVLLRDVMTRAGIPMDKVKGKALASYILAKARDSYRVVYTLGEIASNLGNEAILVADWRDGKPLAGNMGPFRIVCAHDKEGARSIRMLESLELIQLPQ